MRKYVTLLLTLIIAVVCFTSAFAQNVESNELPSYTYTGEDPITGAVANYIAETTPEYDEDSMTTVAIPAPVIIKTEMTDDTHADVYGNFYHMRYAQEGNVLVCVTSSEAPGIMHLEMNDGVWQVVSLDAAGDGELYAKDIQRFSNGDKDLEETYFASGDVNEEPLKSIRKQFIQEYVVANHLEITAYQDLYWDPIALFE